MLVVDWMSYKCVIVDCVYNNKQNRDLLKNDVAIS